MTDARLAVLRELERDDETAAAELAELDRLAAATGELRRRALSLEALLARLPDERRRNAEALLEAREHAEAARATLARAGEELAAAERGRDDERVAAARRFEVRARDSLRLAERRVDDVEADGRRLAAEEAAAERERPELEARAHRLAQSLAGRPRLAAEAARPPGAGLHAVADWGTQARAALLVARGGLASERDATIRQANELGSALLGEPLAAGSAALVARRVAGRLGS